MAYVQEDIRWSKRNRRNVTHVEERKIRPATGRADKIVGYRVRYSLPFGQEFQSPILFKKDALAQVAELNKGGVQARVVPVRGWKVK